MTPTVPDELSRRAAEWSSLGSAARRAIGRDLRRRGAEPPADRLTAIAERNRPAPGTPDDIRQQRRRELEQLQIAARASAPRLSADPRWTVGVALYWAEGSKTTRQLEMSTSDPAALRLFMRWVEGYLEPNAEYRAAVGLHTDNDGASARAYWSDQLELERSDFTKSYLKPKVTGHFGNHLAAGACRVTVRHSTDMWVTATEWCCYLADTMGVLPSRPGR